MLSKYDITIHIKHCVKRIRIRSYSGPHISRIFPHWTEYGEMLRIPSYSVRMQENARKMRTRTTLNKDTYYAVQSYLMTSY